MEYHSALKRKETLIHTTTWINLEDTVLNEINQKHKDKYCDSLCECMRAKSLQLCLTLCDPLAVIYQSPLSMGFSGKNTRVGCHVLLQEVFLTQR